MGLNLFLLLALLFLFAGILHATGSFFAVFGVSVFLVLAFSIKFSIFCVMELLSKDQQPPVAGLIFHQLIHFRDLFDYLTTLARKHRTFRLIKPSHSEIYTVDPANVEYILKTNFSNYSKGEYNCEVMRDLFGHGIFAVDGEKWRHQRKLASYEFSTKNLRIFSSSVFRTNAVRLVSKVATAAKESQPMNMQDLLMKSTLDSIFKVGFGVDLRTLSGSHELGNKFSKAFDDSNFIVYWRFVNILWKIERSLNFGLEASLKKNLITIDGFVFELIRIKREQLKNGTANSGKEDILSRFLVESEKDPENMTDEYLRDIILSFVIAGKDTSANTLTWFIYALCKNPSIQEKVAEDVRKATGYKDRTTAANEFAELVTEEALERMHYLHASLTEALRLYPAVPVDGKSAMEDDVLPDGFKVKKGNGVNVMAYAMGRMTSLWGDDAELFRPERWLADGVFQPESPFKFNAFLAGPRICIGKEFAYRQMKIVAALLLNSYEFKLVNEYKTAHISYHVHPSHGSGPPCLCLRKNIVLNTYTMQEKLMLQRA